MTKKNLKPQQAAPVQRENTATVARATVARDGAIAPSSSIASYEVLWGIPFAGDDAE